MKTMTITIPGPSVRSLLSMDAKRRQGGRMRDRRLRRAKDARSKAREIES